MSILESNDCFKHELCLHRYGYKVYSQVRRRLSSQELSLIIMNPVNRLLEKFGLRVIRLSFVPARTTTLPMRIGKLDLLVPPESSVRVIS